MTEPVVQSIIEAVGIEKSYPQADGTRIQVVGLTNLVIEPGKIVALLGPSGCGKSTLLRMLTGLAQPTSGTLLWHGKPLDGQMPNVAIVFQSFALFPWLTVLENVEAPLEAKGVPAVERHKRALRTLDTVGLDGFETAYPKELSGGMKQRVGFARALVVEPEEPFSALDVLTAENLRGELMELWLSKKMSASAIFIVTHNIEEAVMLADRVMVLGRNPARIRSDFNIRLKHPRDRKSARFVELVDYIYKVMTEPEIEHELPDAETTAEIILPTGGLTKDALKKQEAPVRTARYQMLPHARVGGVAGLTELLRDRGGREDLFRLAEELVLDVEDLLPILEACVLLGFAWLKEGDVQITPQGVAFAEADIQQRKILFRQAALEHVTILKQIDSVLKRKSDHSIADEFFHDILDEHFAEDEVQRQFETAMNWGRYAEIFDYDREKGRLVQTEPTLLAEPSTVPAAEPPHLNPEQKS